MMNEHDLMAQLEVVCKTFGKVNALIDVNLQIHRGSIIGLLGANGAGKSTLLRHIIGLYLPTQGVSKTFGRISAELGPKELARIGYVHQEGALLDWMKVSQLIRYVAAYYPNWNSDLEQQFIKDFDIPTNIRVGKLSPGKRQQLAILLAIAFEPELLILDEPAAGLDPIARMCFLELLLVIIQDPNRTIIISSHILTDIEKVIDHAIVLIGGRVLRDRPLDDLREEFCRVQFEALEDPIPSDIYLPYAVDLSRAERRAVFTLKRASLKETEKLANELHCRCEVQNLSLEDSYKTLIAFETRKDSAQ